MHFKGSGIEDNYYLLRPIWFNNGEQVKNKRTFLLAKAESVLIEGIDFILFNHLDAVLAAKIKYHANIWSVEEWPAVERFLLNLGRLSIIMKSAAADRQKTKVNKSQQAQCTVCKKGFEFGDKRRECKICFRW